MLNDALLNEESIEVLDKLKDDLDDAKEVEFMPQNDYKE